MRTIAEHDPLRQSASLLFKAVVFRPDGHSGFMTGPEGYSTSVLAGDDPVTVSTGGSMRSVMGGLMCQSMSWTRLDRQR